MFPLTPAIAIDAGNSNLHVSNGAIETNASSDAGHGSGDLALYAISLHCFRRGKDESSCWQRELGWLKMLKHWP